MVKSLSGSLLSLYARVDFNANTTSRSPSEYAIDSSDSYFLRGGAYWNSSILYSISS